jgi:hypothetical protein
MQKLLSFGLTHRGLTIAIIAAITIFCGLGLDKLRIDTSFDSLISDNDPSKLIYEGIKDEFGSDNTTIVYVRSSDLWTEDRIAALEEMHFALEDLPFVQRVDSLFNVRSIRDRDGTIESSTVLDGVPFDDAEMQAARDNALYSPLVVGNFVSADGNVTAINVTILKDPGNPDFDRYAYGAIDAAIAPYTDQFDEMFQVGPPRVNADTETGLVSDLSLLAPLSLLVLTVTIVFFLRSGLALVFPIVTSGISLIWGFGFMGYLGIPINILSAMLPSLVIVIGSTEDTHMLSTYLNGISTGSKEGSRSERRRFAVMFLIRHLGLPLILTSVTTTLGFAANSFADMSLMRNFAYSASMAIAANGVITLLLVPTMLSFFGPLRSRLHDTSSGTEARDPNDDGFRGLIGFVLRFCYAAARHPRWVIGGTVLAAIVFGFFAFQTKVSNDPIAFFKPNHPLVQDVNTLADTLSGMEIFYINLSSTRLDAFRDPDNLRRLAAIKDYIENDGRFDTALSIADHLSLVNREFHGGDPAMMTVPETSDLVDQYLLFFQRSDLESYISHDFERANIVVRHNIHNSHELKGALIDLDREVRRIAGPDLTVNLVGQNLMINNAADDLIAAQVQSVGLLLLVIFIIMSLVYGSMIGGFLSLVPNILPIIMVLGVMGIFNIPLNPGTATVAVIAIGIAIDDTIHLLSSYTYESHRTEDRDLAVRRTVRGQAVPAISTSIALAVGFLVLSGSSFSIIWQFGALSAVAMIIALIADLIVTPVLMSMVRLVGIYEILTLKIGKDVLNNSPLFAGMSSYQIRKAILLSEIVPFKTGDRLLQQGSIGRNMYVLLSGSAMVTLDQKHGQTNLDTLNEGAVLGEVGFISEQERTANVDALTDGEMLRLNADKVHKNMRLYPHIASKLNINIARILGTRLASTSSRLAKYENQEAISG